MNAQTKLNNFSYLFGILIVLTIIFSTVPILVFAAGSNSSGVKTMSLGHTVDDQTLKYKLNQVLHAQIPDSNFSVAVDRSKVLITGQVATTSDKVKAGKSITETYGVSKVWNYLSVGANENPQAVTKDAYLTSIAKERLLAQNGVNSNNMKVVTSSQVVYILGHNAGKYFQVKAAMAKIRQVGDVKDVVNLIE